MGRLQGMNVDNRFLERLGFAVSAFEYFMALEESEMFLGFGSFWPSMVAASLHIQHAGYECLQGVGEDFLNRYLQGLFGYAPGRRSPVILDAPVESDVCYELIRVLGEGETVARHGSDSAV